MANAGLGKLPILAAACKIHPRPFQHQYMTTTLSSDRHFGSL